MITSFTHKQIPCEHCGFEFSYLGFDSAAKIVCPACGESNVPSAHKPPEEPLAVEEIATGPPEELLATGELATVPPQPVLCSVEHCPLLTGGESGEIIAERLGVRFIAKKKRRRAILAWTVTLQVCVLLGVALFAAKTLMIPNEESSIPLASEAATPPPVSSEELFPPIPFTRTPEHVAPLPAEPETKTAWNSAPTDKPFMVAVLPQPTLSPPYDMQPAVVPEIFPPPVHDYPPMTPEPQGTPPATLAAHVWTVQPEPDPIPAQPQDKPITLETADELLESAKTILATDPKSSVEQAAQAAQIYEKLGQPLPDSMYWILGNAFVSLVWGEPLLESSVAVETMTLSPDSRYLLAHLKNKAVWLWDLRSPEKERLAYLLDSGTAEYVKFVFTPDYRWIIGGQKDGTIRIWDISLKNPEETLITFAERLPGLQDLQISPNGQWLAAFGSAPRGGTLSANPLSAGQLTPGQSIQQVNYQRPDRFQTSDSSYPVLVWNLRQMDSGVVPMAIPVPPAPQPVQVLRFSPNSDRLAIGRKDAVVRVYDLTERGISDEPFILRGHLLGITQLAFAPSGQWIATGSQDNTVRLWNLTSSKFSPESATLYGHLGWISALAIDRTGRYIVSGSYDRTIRIWSVQRDRIGTALDEAPIILETGTGVPESLTITQGGDKMVVLGNEGSLGIYHFPSLLGGASDGNYRSVMFRNSRLSISECLFTLDDQFLIFSYEHLSNPSDSGIRLWSLQTKTFLP